MLKQLLYAFLLAITFTACKSDKATEPEGNDPSTSTASTSEPETPAAAAIRYTWVDQLNVRDQPNTKGKVVARVKPNEPLTLTGETSPESETIVLRGVVYHEPWYRITTADKKDGWVFGGAVKEKEAMKGNASIKDDEFDFPAFGYFKLADWTELTVTNSEEGDAETNTRTYKSSEGSLLLIREIQVGEYSYHRNFRLSDDSGNLLKEREFSFTIDPYTITEEVVDHTDIPAKRYSRTQEVDKHFMQLNDLPLMAQGEWTIERVD